MFQHQTTFVPHAANRQSSTLNLKDSEIHLLTMAQKSQISNDNSQSVSADKAPVAMKQSPVSPTRRKYFCEYCSKSFTRNGHLTMHRRTHTGERPFVCQYCNRAFTQSSALYRHHKTCANSPHRGNNDMQPQTDTMLDGASAISTQHTSTFSVSRGTVSTAHDRDRKDESSDEDDDIMFVCCDNMFNSPADYDRHMEVHHSKSSTDSLPRFGKPGGEGEKTPSLATVQLSSSSYRHDVTSCNNTGLDLSNTVVPDLEQRTNACEPNTRVIDNESGIVYLFNNNTTQDIVTINLSEHSVNHSERSGGKFPSNISIMDESANPEMTQITPKLTRSSNDSVNDDDDDNDAVIVDDDDDVCIETVSMTTQQNTKKLTMHDEILITENNASERRQINQPVALKKQKETYLRYSESSLDVARRSSSYNAEQHQKSLSGSSYIRNLPNSLSFVRSASENANKNTNDANNQEKSVKTNKGNTKIEKTVSGNKRIKTSRLQSCSFCSRQFIRSSHLTQHLRTHTRERPFRCEYCGNAFTQSSALNRHLKTCNIAQSVNSSVAGNTTSSHQSSTMSCNINAGNDVYIPYTGDVFQQSTLLDARLKTHNDPSNSKVDMRNAASKCNSMLLRDDNESADNIHTAISRTSIFKNKSCAAKVARRLIEDQTTQPKKKFLLQKPLKSERMLRCDICCVEFLSRQHFTTHMRKHLRANPGLARSVPSLSRSSPTSSFAWPFYMKNKHSFRNKFYNALKYKRNFEKQKSSLLATNSQFGHAASRTKTNSFVDKIVKKFKHLSRRSKAEDSRTSDQLHHSNMSPVRNASSEKKIVNHQSFEKSIQNSVVTDTNRNPQNSLYFSGPAHEINPHRTNRISTKLYSCNICAKSFYSDLLLRIHRATHSLGTKKRNFLLQSTSVMVQNKAEKTYPCVYCHKRFLRHSHVETHIRTHTGEKPFKCENCGRAFSQSSARNRHRNKTCFVARRQVRNSILLSPPSSDHPDLTASIWNIPQTQDEDTSSVLFTCCDQSFHSSIDLNNHLLNHKSSRHPRFEETSCNSAELGPRCEADLENHKRNDDTDRETTNCISESPIKCEERADNDLNVNKYKHSPVDSHAGDSVLETGKSQKFPFESDASKLVSESKDVLNSTVKNEFDVLESKIFDNALQVVQENLQMPSDVHVEQSASNQTKAIPLSEQNPGSLESVSSQNCQDPPDLCPSPPDIPQPNVSLSLGSEFVDIMDTDLPSISNPILYNQEEDSSAKQKDIFLEYSPETPPFVGECLTQSLGVDDVMENDENAKTCKSLSGGASELIPDFDGPDKNYSCDYCNKTFSRLDHLDEHIGIHAGERFFCPSCSAAFMHTSALAKHLKICPHTADHVKKESASKNHFDTPNTIRASQVTTNTNYTDESINGYKLSTVGCLEATTNNRDSASQEATVNTNNKNNVNTNNNLHESFENWTLTFSNDDDVKSENMSNFMSSEKKEEIAENTNNSMFKNIVRPNQLKPLIGSTLDIFEKETPIKTNSPTPTRKLTCPHCDRHFANLGQLDGHVLCHAVKKPYICWFCKDTYVSSLDFEQHLKICGAPTTFPNLSSLPHASKEDANDDEESKFTDIVLFTPLTASGNLSDCEGVGEADLPCNKDQIKDTGVTQHPQQEAGAGMEAEKAEDGHKEKNQHVVKDFENTELISGQPQENHPRDSGSNPDNCSKYTLDFVLLEDSREKDDSSTIQNITSDKSTSNQSEANMNLKNTSRKEQIRVANKALQKDFNLESLSLPSLINSSEYNTNMEAERLKTQSPSEGSNDSIVFLCCEQTFTEVQDYSRHLSKFHPTQERTDKLKDLHQQQITPSEIRKVGSMTCKISQSVSKQSDAGNDQQRYVCSCCTRGFSRSSHLVQHMRTHTGERPFSCKYCTKAFTQSSAVNRHLKTCVKAKLFQNESVKITSTNYNAIMHEFQQTLPERSGSVSQSPVHTFDDMKRNISGETDPFQQPSHVTYKGINNIPDNEISAGIKCEHCGLKCLKLDDFTQHCKTCPSTESTSYLSTACHEEDRDSDEAVDIAESYDHKLPHAYHLEDVEIKKEVADVLYKCEVCHQLFLDESELIQHRESHSTSSDQQWWNVARDFSSRKDLKTTEEDEERSIFNCCGQMFFDSKSYNFHMEVHHYFKVENDYNEINGPDMKFQKMQNSAEKIDVKNEGIDLNKISHNNLADDSLFNSSLQGRQLLSMAKNRYDDVIGKKMSDEASDLSSVNKSTALDDIQRFQVSESVKEISQSETSILLQRIANGNVHNHMSNLGDSVISKKILGMNLSASAVSERTLTNDMNMDWLQWKNYITGQFLSSGLSTAQMMPREKKYVCDYCDKRFTRSGHLVMHRRTHTGERPFRCRHCQKAFTQSSALNRHLKTCNLARLTVIGNAETQVTFPVSEDEIRLTCCGKNFYSAGAVNVHLVTHDIYKCHCCNVDFENFNLLLIHMKSRDPHEQLPVSNSREESTDDHCVFCPASFQSVIEQLLHVKTNHQVDVSEIGSSDNHITPDQVNFPRHSSKSTNLDMVNFSKDSDLLSSQKYTNPSLRPTSPQQKGSFSNQLNMRKMPRFKRLLSSTFRKPSKLNTFLKRQQNKSEINPASTLLKQRYSILFPEHKLTGSPKYTRYSSSLRNTFTHNTRQVFKQDVNSISKPNSFSERFATSSDERALTQTNNQQTIGIRGKRFPDQRQQTETVETLLDKKDSYKKNSKNASQKDVVENNSFVQKRKNLSDKLTLNDRDVDYYSESEVDNDLELEDRSSYQAESSMEISLKQEQGSHMQSGKCLKSDMLKYPNLKSRSNNSLPVKRSSLSRRLVSSGSEKNSRLTKAVPIPVKFNFKYGKSKRTSGSTLSSKQSDFVCIVCQKYFTCSSHLRLHLRTHADVWPYVCTNCNHYFIQASALNRHRKNCPYRNQNSTSSNSQVNRDSVLQNSETSKLSNALSDEDKDTSAFDEEEILLAVSQDDTDTVKKSKEVLSNEHDRLPSSFYQAVHHTDDSVDPSPKKGDNYLNTDNSTCSKDPSDWTGLSLPQSAHSKKDKSKTEIINEQLVISPSRQLTSGLADSILASFPGDRKDPVSHTCKKCDATFLELTDLNQHKCSRSADRHAFFCEYCDKSFPRQSRLVTHRRTHTGERPYQCVHCQRSFTQSGALNRHKKICSFIPTHLKTTAPIIGSTD